MEYVMAEFILPHLLHIAPRNPVPEIAYPNCSVYAVVDDAYLLLIDTGNGFSHKSILDDLRAAGLLDGRPITVLLTHCHVDHVGGVEYFHRSMEICAAPQAAEHLRIASHRIWYEAPELLRPLVVHTELPPGRRQIGPFAVEVVPTPGHTDDSLSFVLIIDGKCCIFSGDLIMPSGTIGWRGSDDYSQEKLVASLRWLDEQQYDYLLTGHDYTGPEMRDRVRKTLEIEESKR